MTEMISGLSLANDNIAFKQSATQSHTLLTTPYRIGQERKNFTVNLSVAGHKYYISWLVAIGIKSFHRGLF